MSLRLYAELLLGMHDSEWFLFEKTLFLLSYPKLREKADEVDVDSHAS